MMLSLGGLGGLPHGLPIRLKKPPFRLPTQLVSKIEMEEIQKAPWTRASALDTSETAHISISYHPWPSITGWDPEWSTTSNQQYIVVNAWYNYTTYYNSSFIADGIVGQRWSQESLDKSEAIDAFEDQFPDLGLSDVTKAVMLAGATVLATPRGHWGTGVGKLGAKPGAKTAVTVHIVYLGQSQCCCSCNATGGCSGYFADLFYLSVGTFDTRGNFLFGQLWYVLNWGKIPATQLCWFDFRFCSKQRLEIAWP